MALCVLSFPNDVETILFLCIPLDNSIHLSFACLIVFLAGKRLWTESQQFRIGLPGLISVQVALHYSRCK